ncbi:hypothetical protein L1887_40299 [Cichorium endivia]|nr:hypothetical protein L1887_40299 [Cichorium endivia]
MQLPFSSGVMLTKERHLKTWISSIYVLIRLLMEDFFFMMIVETDGNMIVGKVATHSIDEGSPLSEQMLLDFLLPTNCPII